MPEGVEYKGKMQEFANFTNVIYSVMPKGVEHNSQIVIAAIERT